MTLQLILLDDTDHDWKLDETTRERGRRGIAQAREVLQHARRNDEATERDHSHAHAA